MSFDDLEYIPCVGVLFREPVLVLSPCLPAVGRKLHFESFAHLQALTWGTIYTDHTPSPAELEVLHATFISYTRRLKLNEDYTLGDNNIMTADLILCSGTVYPGKITAAELRLSFEENLSRSCTNLRIVQWSKMYTLVTIICWWSNLFLPCSLLQ
jgi:hypothetical protein